MQRHALSHLQVSHDAVELSRISVAAGDREFLNAEFVPDWDFSTDLRVVVEVDVDLGGCFAQSGLLEDSVLALNVVWHATGSGLRGSSARVDVSDRTNTAALSLDGGELGGQLNLDVFLTLGSPGIQISPIAASRPGSILWTVRRSIRLEGDGSRFPISTVSFKEAGIADGLQSAWSLLFDTAELYDSGLGNVRLYLNSDHPAVLTLLSTADGDSEMITKVLHADINRVLVLRALGIEDLDLDEDYPTESMGELLALALRRNFPDQSLEAVRALLRNRPGEFEAHIQARGGFLL